MNTPNRGRRKPKFSHSSQRYSTRHRSDQKRNSAAPVRKPGDFERQFLSGTPIDPSPRICMEKGSAELTMRALDLIAPVGMGQRGLIVAPPGSGKTTFLKHICQAVAKAEPDVKLYCLLIDERPEEVTDFRRQVPGEVRWSSSDQSYEHHIETADTLMRDVFTQAAEGHHVMVVIDSLTRLARVHNAQRPAGGRTMSGGVDTRAMEIPRRIFGSARNIEGGGSLSILATILVDTGSRMDQVIFEEFKGTGNMEIVLSRDIASRRIFPAIDIAQSNTRKIELLVPEEELRKVDALRRSLVALGKVEAAQTLMDKLSKYPTNAELLAAVNG